MTKENSGKNFTAHKELNPRTRREFQGYSVFLFSDQCVG